MSISYSKHKQQLDINYLKFKFKFIGARTKKQSTIKIRGLLESSNTLGLIKDAIVQRRPKQPQTIRYTIPHITNTYKSHTITLNPNHNTVDYKGKRKDTVSFIDGLGSVDEEGSRLVFWSPPVGRTRVHSPGGYISNNQDSLFKNDQPEIVVNFPDERSCSNFKLAVVASRDSLNETTTAVAAISQSMDYRSHDFEWSASDDPSEINCLPTCSETMVLMCFCIFFSPCISYAIYNSWKEVTSQRVKITGTQIDFEHTSPRCCCCSNPESKRTYHINLKDVRMIHNTSKQLKIYFFTESFIEIRGLVDNQRCYCSKTSQAATDYTIHDTPYHQYLQISDNYSESTS